MRWPVINSSSANPLPRSSRCLATPGIGSRSTPKGIAPDGRRGYDTPHTQSWEDLDALSDVRADRLVGRRDRLRDVGAGGLDRLGRRGVARLARAGDRAGVQLLRHGLGLRRGAQRAAARPGRAGAIRAGRSTSRPRSRRRTNTWPSRRGFALDDCFPPDHIRAVRREEPGEPRPAAHRPAPVPRLGGRLGPRRPLAARDGRPEARGAGPGGRRERQPLGAVERRWRPCGRAWSTRCR